MQRIREFWIAFRNFAIILSFIVNTILITVLLVLMIVVFQITGLLEGLIDGLHDSFVDLNEARIVTEIEVNDEIPIEFTLPLEQQTNVVLAEDVLLPSVPAVFSLPAGGGTINGNVAIILPKDTVLPVHLDLDVPVEQQIPINLNVPVDIPLDQTELSEPFTDLVDVVDPYHRLLCNLPEERGRVPVFAARALSGDLNLLDDLEADNRCNLPDEEEQAQIDDTRVELAPEGTPQADQDGGQQLMPTPTFTPFPTPTATPGNG